MLDNILKVIALLIGLSVVILLAEAIIFVELFLNCEKIAQASGYFTANAVSDKRWARAKAKYVRDKFLLDRKKAPRFKLNYGNM